MDREIKFRAWDGQRFYYFANHAYTLSYNDICGWGVNPNVPGYDKMPWTTGESSSTAEHFDLQQYTGLKDRTGHNIYEGDIVGFRGDADYRGVVRFGTVDLDINASECSTIITGFYVDTKLPSLRDHMSCQMSQGQVELLGNIHENPELAPKSEE